MRQIAILIGVLLLAVPAKASVIGKGTVELSTAAIFNHTSYSDDLGSSSMLDLRGGVSYAVTDLVQIGGALVVQNQSADLEEQDSISSTAFGVEASVGFNLGSSQTTVPFLGLSVGMLNWSGDGFEDAEATVFFGGVAGLRFLVGSHASLNTSVVLARQSNAAGVEDLDATGFSVQVGISIFPGGLKN